MFRLDRSAWAQTFSLSGLCSITALSCRTTQRSVRDRRQKRNHSRSCSPDWWRHLFFYQHSKDGTVPGDKAVLWTPTTCCGNTVCIQDAGKEHLMWLVINASSEKRRQCGCFDRWWHSVNTATTPNSLLRYLFGFLLTSVSSLYRGAAAEHLRQTELWEIYGKLIGVCINVWIASGTGAVLLLGLIKELVLRWGGGCVQAWQNLVCALLDRSSSSHLAPPRWTPVMFQRRFTLFPPRLAPPPWTFPLRLPSSDARWDTPLAL